MNKDIQDYKTWCAANSYDVLPCEREQIAKYRAFMRNRRKAERVSVIMATIADFYRVHVGPDNCCAGIDGTPEFIPRVLRSDIEPTETETGLFGVERGDGNTLPGTTPAVRAQPQPVNTHVINGNGRPLDYVGRLNLDELTDAPVYAPSHAAPPQWFRPVCWPERVPLGDAARHIDVSPSSLHRAACTNKIRRNPDGTFHIKDVELWAATRGQTVTA